MFSKRSLGVFLIIVGVAATAWADDHALDAKAKAIGAAKLGKPSGKAKSLPDGGRVRMYTKGAIYWSDAGGTHAIYGAAYTKYKALGAQKSTLGYPVTDGGGEVILQHGAIEVSKSGRVTVRKLPAVTFTTTTATLDGGDVKMASNTDALLLPQSGAGGEATITCSCDGPVIGRPGSSCEVTLLGNKITCSKGTCSGSCQITIVK